MCRISACSCSVHGACPYNLGSCSFTLLELAANDDLAGLKQAVEEHGAQANECANWYCRQYGSNKMASVERSPLMIAALFGNIEVLQYLLDHLAIHGGGINSVCGEDKATALHCALSSGTRNMSDVVQLLLRYGADPTLVSPRGLYDAEAKSILSQTCHQIAKSGKGLLNKENTSLNNSLNISLESEASDWKVILPDSVSETSFEDLEESRRNPQDSNAAATWSPKSNGSRTSVESQDGTYDCAFDTLCPDVKSSIYSTDEFRMYSFKVRPCSRAYSHDWTECPFAHPGENARRRDPRRFHYSCVPCPDFRKGACGQGDACEYAHGVFESWLHPAQYRTRLCKDGTSCARKVCFFAHTKEEVRPLYVSTECGVGSCPSPCASPSVKPSALLSGGMNLGPLSPSSMGRTWTQPGLPPLRLPEGLAHPSKLRASLSARDMVLDRELVSLSAHARINAAIVAASNSSTLLNSPVRDRKLQSSDSSIANFEEGMYSAVSPRSPLQIGMHSSSRMASKFPDSSIANVALEELIAAMAPPRHSICSSSLQGRYDDWGHLGNMLNSPTLSGNFGYSLPSPRAEAGFLHKHSMESSSCLSPAHREERTRLDWGSPTGKPEWGVSGDDLTRFRKSNSCRA